MRRDLETQSADELLVGPAVNAAGAESRARHQAFSSCTHPRETVAPGGVAETLGGPRRPARNPCSGEPSRRRTAPSATPVFLGGRLAWRRPRDDRREDDERSSSFPYRLEMKRVNPGFRIPSRGHSMKWSTTVFTWPTCTTEDVPSRLQTAIYEPIPREALRLADGRGT